MIKGEKQGKLCELERTVSIIRREKQGENGKKIDLREKNKTKRE